MCNPVVGAVIGGGQAALGAIGQNQAIKARNKNRAKLYANDLARIHGQHLVNIGNYYLRGVDAEIAWDENALKASQAVDAQDVIINEAIAKSLKDTETDYVKMISDPRIAKSLERTGQTARRAGRSARAALGRAKAGRAASISRQRDKAAISLAEIQQLRREADRDAYMKIGFEPQRAADPPKPVFEKGPSLFSTLTKIALGAAQGYFMGKDLQGAVPKKITPGVDTAKAITDATGGSVLKEWTTDQAINASSKVVEGSYMAPVGGLQNRWELLTGRFAAERSWYQSELADKAIGHSDFAGVG